MNSKYKNRKHKISFKLALGGIFLAAKTQPNLKIMAVFAFLAALCGYLLEISYFEWLVLLLAIFIVFIAEMINTSIEAMVDLITTEWREEARIAKDIGSGMVLVAVICSLVIGLAVFLPKIIILFYG